MEFFEPPPPAPPWKPPDDGWITGPWTGPPGNALPGIAPLRFVLARLDGAVIFVTDIRAYLSGFEFTVRVRALPSAQLHRGQWTRLGHRVTDDEGRIRPSFLRLGLVFSDGQKATNVHEHPTIRRRAEPPTAPMVTFLGGQGTDAAYTSNHWISPLPPPGPLTFAAEWPKHDLSLTQVDVDAKPIVEASQAARLLWGDAEEAHGVGGSINFVTAKRTAEVADEEGDDE